MQAQWHIQLFGQLRARQGEREIRRFRTRKTAELFAYLAYYRQRSHAREFLIELLWPEEDLDATRNSFSVALNALRRDLEPSGVAKGTVLRADRTFVSLNPMVCETDVEAFESALRSAEQTEDEDARRVWLETAVQSYQGDLLPGFYADWILAEQERLRDRYIGALRRLAVGLAQSRAFDRALDYAHRAFHADPLREASCRDLMSLYALSGQPALGLEKFHELEQKLRETLGTAPSPKTRELASQLEARLSQTPSEPLPEPSATTALPAAPPAVPALALPRFVFPGNALAQGTAFFGREEEIARLERLLRPHRGKPIPSQRLVTLAGPGGVGKTRLAFELANRLYEAFDEAVWFVSLKEASPGWLPEYLRNVLGLPRARGVEPLKQVEQMLAQQPSLLILDNFEHLLAEVGPDFTPHRAPLSVCGSLVIRALLDHVPTLCCLITSRQRLDIGGEQAMTIAPLPLPGSAYTPEEIRDCPSVQLWMQRMQTHGQTFVLTPENAPAVAELCNRLEGFPLLLELAAASDRAQNPAQLVQELQGQGDMPAGLHGPAQTLQALMDWSYDLLPQELQSFFARLSVFHGGWTLEAAETVCEEPMAVPYLMQLLDRSLIAAREAGKAMRYAMSEPVREYADSQLTEPERMGLARRQTLWLASMAEEFAALSTETAPHAWLEYLEAEMENLQAALTWCQAKDTALGLKLMTALHAFQLQCGALPDAQKALTNLLQNAPKILSDLPARALAPAQALENKIL